MKEELKDWVCQKIDSGVDSIITINGGGIVEMADHQIRRAIANIADINTTMGTREVTIKLKISPMDDQRTAVVFVAEVPPAKLCGQEAVKSVSDIHVASNGTGPYSKQKENKQMGLPFSNVVSIKE